MRGQMSLPITGFIRDMDCTMDTPVVLGNQDTPVYGTGKRIKPMVEGRKDSKHFEEIYLEELLPLEEYDLIVVLFSGGKDSTACYYKLLELAPSYSWWTSDEEHGLAVYAELCPEFCGG